MGITEYSSPIGGSGLSYAIDDQDRLVRLDEGFYEFAERNGRPGCDACLGRSLWDFIAGEEMRKLQRMLIRRVRDSRRPVELRFRCDSPGGRREMDLRIVAGASARAVLFRTSLRSELRRPPQPLLDAEAPRGAEAVTMCGWCDRFAVAGEWIEVEEASARLGLFERSALPRISHGVCDECYERLLAA